MTIGSYPAGSTMTYVSNSEINGPTAGWGEFGVNVCAGVTDTTGAFYSNTCP